MSRYLAHGLIAVAVFVALQITPPTLPISPASTASAEDITEQVQQLIEELGSPEYATRLRARQQLRRMGLEAFDELDRATMHIDNEIAMAAKHLAGSLVVRWFKEYDPPEVRSLLEEYGGQSLDERLRRIEALADLPNRQGLEALVRLARYEPNTRLSSVAALTVLRQTPSGSAEQRSQNSELINQHLRGSERLAADWLRAYAGDLQSGSYAADRWQQLVAEKRQAIDAAATDQADYAMALELVQVSAARAADLGETDAALQLALEHIDLVQPRTSELTEAASWAIDQDLYAFVLELRQIHSSIFEQHPTLLYSVAEAYLVGGQDEAAEAAAKKALRAHSLPETKAQLDALSPASIAETAAARREIAKELQSRGLFAWAEREYETIQDALPTDNLSAAMIRYAHSAMLAEQQRHREAAQVLAPLVERINKDDTFRTALDRTRYLSSLFIASHQLQLGLAAAAEGNLEKARQLLLQAWETDRSQNPDIMIALYHLDGDQAWREKVSGLLERAIRAAEIRVRDMGFQARQMRFLVNQDEALAQYLNEYAWLVANTEGDTQQALQYSLRAVELLPDTPALIDTLARCYFAAGMVDKAIQTQRQAVEFMPHSPAMLRQLEEFQAKAAEEASAQ